MILCDEVEEMNRFSSLLPNNKFSVKDEFENEMRQAAEYSLFEIKL